MKENGPDLFVKFKRELSIKKRNKKAFITHVSRFSDEHIKELVEKGMLIGVRRFVYMFEPYLELKQKHETNSKDLEELLELN